MFVDLRFGREGHQIIDASLVVVMPVGNEGLGDDGIFCVQRVFER